MIDYEPIEGVDYIFDRFAYLELSPDAAREDIARVIKQKRVELHPDRLLNVHEDVLKKAEAIRKYVDDCASILLNDDLRPLYTERLQEFRKNKPNMVSANGTPIINLAEEKLHLDFLLNADEMDIEELKKQVQAMSGYNPKQLAAVQRMYAVDPDDDTRDMLTSALTAKFTYLTILEEAAWARAGIISFKANSEKIMIDPEEYLRQMEEEITHRHNSITDHVATRSDALRIGVAQAPLLLEGMKSEGASASRYGLSADIQKKLTEKAQETFVGRAELIREIVKEKKEVLGSIMEILLIEDLGVPIDTAKPYGLHLVHTEEEQISNATVIFSMEVDAAGTIVPFKGNKTKGMSVSDLKKAGFQGATILFNQEVGEPFMQIAQGAKRYTEKYIDLKAVRPMNSPDGDVQETATPKL